MKSKQNHSAGFFFEKESQWQDAYRKLRTIILDCGLDEELKWGKPCYTWQGANVVLMHGFKEYCALLFLKGALLKDDAHILIQQTENVQSARQIRFTDSKEITKLKATIKAYIYEAIEIEKAGLKVDMKKSTTLVYPEEFQRLLDKSAKLRKAFESLTPGRQRGYHLFFTGAKQAKTREARVEKSIPLILAGKGLED
ncbi:MAG: YdeI/OmpD-associated family protein [Bacteroidetes bacterium]|nr:YdeI/OmpD-associated family protein [Bacteroidota bacterium]